MCVMSLSIATIWLFWMFFALRWMKQLPINTVHISLAPKANQTQEESGGARQYGAVIIYRAESWLIAQSGAVLFLCSLKGSACSPMELSAVKREQTLCVPFVWHVLFNMQFEYCSITQIKTRQTIVWSIVQYIHIWKNIFCIYCIYRIYIYISMTLTMASVN